jgi:dihydrofolate reductase
MEARRAQFVLGACADDEVIDWSAPACMSDDEGDSPAGAGVVENDAAAAAAAARVLDAVHGDLSDAPAEGEPAAPESTWESLPARFRPLPGRRNVVVSRNLDYPAQGAEVLDSLAGALADGDQTWVIGGAEIYHLALPLATRCEVTEVQVDLRPDDDDALAPVLDETWTGTAGGWQDSTSGLRYRFSTYLRP